MFAKSARLISLGLRMLLITVLLYAIQAVKIAYAQSSAPTASVCITCHEDQYYLYDSGKWYCIAEAQDRCENCHAGNAGEVHKTEAHLGLIAHPLTDGGQRCQTCHAGDTEKFIQAVISRTGYQAPLQVEPYVPIIPVDPAAPISLPVSSEPFISLWLIPGAIGTFAFWLWLVTRTSRA